MSCHFKSLSVHTHEQLFGIKWGSAFSNSLIIITESVWISGLTGRFFQIQFYIHVHFSLVLATIEKTYQAIKTAFDHISKPHGLIKMLHECYVHLPSS